MLIIHSSSALLPSSSSLHHQVPPNTEGPQESPTHWGDGHCWILGWEWRTRDAATNFSKTITTINSTSNRSSSSSNRRNHSRGSSSRNCRNHSSSRMENSRRRCVLSPLVGFFFLATATTTNFYYRYITSVRTIMTADAPLRLCASKQEQRQTTNTGAWGFRLP